MCRGRRVADIGGMKRTGDPQVSCTACGFEWYSQTAAHALRTLGSCTRCRGELSFATEPAPPAIAEPSADVPAHLVLGTPRY